MGFYEAELKFERAGRMTDPARQPVEAEVIGGLIEIAKSLNLLSIQVQQIEQRLQSMGR